MNSSAHSLLIDLFFSASFVFIGAYLTTYTEDIFRNTTSSSHWIINITILVVCVFTSVFLSKRSFQRFNQGLIFDFPQHNNFSFTLENIEGLSESDKALIIKRLENENPFSSSGQLTIKLVRNILTVLFFNLIVAFIIQILSAFFKLQNALYLSGKLDDRVRDALPKATLVEGVSDAAMITLIFSAITASAAISAQIFAWRGDRRSKGEEELKKIETSLRIEKLELEVKDLREKAKPKKPASRIKKKPQLPPAKETKSPRKPRQLKKKPE